MAMPKDAAANHRWRAPAARFPGPAARSGLLPAFPPSVRNALFIGGILFIGAVFAWYEDASAGRSVGEWLAALAGRQPDIRGDFDVHLVENRLIYVKEQCGSEDIEARFFLHVYPVSPDDLPDLRKPHGFDNLDFRADRYGRTCLAEVSLPDYEIAAIQTGQLLEAEGGGHRDAWKGGIRVQMTEREGKALAAYLAKFGERRPAIQSDFDMYLVENRLIYVKENCTQDDIDPRFFLHVYPVSPDDLPDHGKPHGFDDLSFRFDQYGTRSGRICLAEISLPGYDIAAIGTGQFVEAAGGDQNIWEGDIQEPMAGRVVGTSADEHPADLGERQPAAYFHSDTNLHVRVDKVTLGEYLDKLRERSPDVHSDFDVRLVEDRLIYLKENCTQDDIDPWFFLHVYPVSPDDLPDLRKPHGFDNLSFRFDQYGTRSGRTCLADAPLPSYGIAVIQTGQYLEAESGYRRLWEGNIEVE